jgi:LysR family transcriptional regulator, nitrogen assimilation regulatory protein
MNFRQLRYFVQIVDAGNMTRAAEQLNVAQPALGMQIKQLEEDLGTSLLVRHSRGITPTAAGLILYRRANEILKLVEETRQEVASSDEEPDEPLRFGMTPSLMQIVGPELAIHMQRMAPNVRLTLSEEMSHLLVEALQRNDLDLILGYEVTEEAGYWMRALYQEDLVMVTSSVSDKGKPIRFAEVLKQPLVLPEARDSVRMLVDGKARELGLDLKIAHEIRSIPGLKTMIQRSVAVGILPFGTVSSEVELGTLSMRPIVSPALRRTLFLSGTRRVQRLRSFPAILDVVQRSVETLASSMGALGHLLTSEGRDAHSSA